MSAAQMLELFRPAPHAHGVYEAPPASAREKRKGEARTNHSPVTEALMARHLRGEIRIGFVPIHRDGLCYFGALDVDDYRLDHSALVDKIARLRLPLVVCRSKSGGAHLYRFRRCTAAAMREELVSFAAALGYEGVEIFPKQGSIDDNETGNWINAPYHGAECCAVGAGGRDLPIEEFFAAAEAAKHLPPTAPQSDIDRSAAILAEAWTAGQRDNLATAVYGTLLRGGWSADLCDDLVRRTCELAGDEEASLRIKGVAMERRLRQDRATPGIRMLRQYLGSERCDRLLRAAHIDEGVDLALRPLGAEWLDNPPPPLEFTVQPLVPRRTVALLVAEGGTGKTNFLLRMGLCVAMGRPFFGLDVTAGRVAFVALEDGEDALRRRVHWLWRCERERMQEEQRSPADIDQAHDALAERLLLTSMVGRELHLVRMHDGQAVQNGGALNALIEQLAGVELVVLDPMARLSGAEENSNSVGTAMVNAAERIAREVGCAVVLAHHVGKANAKERDTSLYSARGASGFADAARSVIRLLVANADDLKDAENISPEAVAAGEVVRVIHAKCNEAARLPEFHIRRQASDFALWRPERGGAEVALDGMLRRLHAWWAAHAQRPFSQSTVEEARDAIFGDGTARHKARSTVAQARHRGDLVESGQTADRSRAPLLTFRSGYDPHPM